MSKPTTKITRSAGGLRCAAVSDVGMRRASNQDSLAISLADDDRDWRSRGHLFVVADGMGAHAAGELASQIATDNIPHAYQKRRDLPPCESIIAAVHDANAKINSKGQNSVDFHGMGTTCSCLLLLPDGAMAAHVGDSRVCTILGGSVVNRKRSQPQIKQAGFGSTALGGCKRLPHQNERVRSLTGAPTDAQNFDHVGD